MDWKPRLSMILAGILDAEEISQVEYYMQYDCVDFIQNVRNSLIHFYDNHKQDKTPDKQDVSLYEDADTISSIFPDVSYNFIYDYVLTFAQFHNRKEIVLRLLLKLHPNYTPGVKRKIDSTNSSNGGEIKLKIFKRDGEYATNVSSNNSEGLYNWNKTKLDKPATITSGALTSSHTSSEPATSATAETLRPNPWDTLFPVVPVVSDNLNVRPEPILPVIKPEDESAEVSSTTPNKPLLPITSGCKVSSTRSFIQPAKFQIDRINFEKIVLPPTPLVTTRPASEPLAPPTIQDDANIPKARDIYEEIIESVPSNNEQITAILKEENKLEKGTGVSNVVKTVENNMDHTTRIINWLKEGFVDETEEKVDLTKDTSIAEENSDDVLIDENKDVDLQVVFRILEMFPEACPNYVRSICKGKGNSEAVINDLINHMLENDRYPRRAARPQTPENEMNLEQQFEMLKEIFPDADPDYLLRKCEEIGNGENDLKIFIANSLEKKDYPTMKEYKRKQQMSAQHKQYTTEFNVEKFLQVIPDPFTMFNDPKYSIKLDSESSYYLKTFLKNRYNKITIQTINSAYNQQNGNIIKICKALESIKTNLMKAKRKSVPLPNNIQNIPLLQAIAYVNHKDTIKEYIEKKKVDEQMELEVAKALGRLCTCNCCFDEEIMEKNIFTCDNGCSFCKDCIRKSAEVASGEGILDFPCLTDCNSSFSLQTLQNVLDPKLFSKIAQKKALAEIKAAGIEDLSTCPFCDFATILPETDKIFQCLNAECMKESCRECKEPSHVPLRCDEVEKDQEVKARTYIENKMTEALLRECYRCNKKFFKEEGCNKMTCSCGAKMCYVCKKPVTDYSHFNGLGGDKHHLCPLFSDTNELNKQAVLKGAEEAKAEIGVQDKKLKIDPSADIKTHYADRATKVPKEPHLNMLQHHNNHQQVIVNMEREIGVLNRFLNERYHVHHRPNHHRHRHHGQNPNARH